MRLFEAIMDANHRAVSGDTNAGLHTAEYADSLPVVSLTCIDPRLNPLLPAVLGIPQEKFIWLRNAGNIITSSLSSTMRSIALACAVKGGREIAVIGHTQCQVGQTTMLQITERFRALGIGREKLPENLTEFFGVFASERQNVLRAVEFIRNSPIIGPKIPVHGLMVDIQTGKLEWIINGYQALEAAGAQMAASIPAPKPNLQNAFASPEQIAIGNNKTFDQQVGDTHYSAPPKDAPRTTPPPPPPPPPPQPKLTHTHEERPKRNPQIPVPPPIQTPRPFKKAWWEE